MRCVIALPGPQRCIQRSLQRERLNQGGMTVWSESHHEMSSLPPLLAPQQKKYQQSRVQHSLAHRSLTLCSRVFLMRNHRSSLLRPSVSTFATILMLWPYISIMYTSGWDRTARTTLSGFLRRRFLMANMPSSQVRRAEGLPIGLRV